MSFLEQIISLDHWLYSRINGGWVNSFFDFFFPYITDLTKRPLFLYAVFPALLVYSLYRGRLRTVKIILFAVLVFAASDSFTHRVLKPTFTRQRPEFVLDKVQLRTHSHSGYSFPSNHAANSFAIMVFLSFFLPRWRLFLLSYAALVAYSRVYVGVHFPIDVTAGAIIGSAIGICGYLLVKNLKITKISFARKT